MAFHHNFLAGKSRNNCHMAFKILSRSKLVVLIPLFVLIQLYVSCYNFLYLQMQEVGLFLGFQKDHLIRPNDHSIRRRLNKIFYRKRVNGHGVLKEIVSQSNELIPWRCWCPNNKPGHPFAHFKVLYSLIHQS